MTFGSIDPITPSVFSVIVILRTKDDSDNELIESDNEDGVKEVLILDTKSCTRERMCL